MAEDNLDLKAGSESPLRLRMGEISTIGLKVSNDKIYEEMKKELRWPTVITTYKQMSYDATIASAIELFEMMIARVEWSVEPPVDATPEQQKKAKFIEQCKDDMEHTWMEFIQEITTYLTYGFSVHEKVYRRRLPETGSKYSDGLVGWKKLPVRSQDTIEKFKFSPDGRDVIGVEQDLSASYDLNRFRNILTDSNKINIPRKKFLLFRTNPKRNNPEGNSPLKKVYFAWKYRTLIEEQEAIGISRDMVGMPVIKIPPRYMSEDATPEEKGIYDHYQKIIRNIHNNEQSGLVLPQAHDPETRQPLFDFTLMGVQGGKQYDTDKIIKRWDNKILTLLFADFLKMGQDQVGSFALAGEKTSLMTMAVEARLQEMSNTLNSDLIPQTFKMNGWSDTDYPKFKFGDLNEVDLEEFSKAIQRVFSVNAIEADRPVMNKIRTTIFKVDPKAEDAPVNKDELPKIESRSGDGMAKGSSNGTSDSAAETDTSASNADNAG
jgi:hypothetical protein